MFDRSRAMFIMLATVGMIGSADAAELTGAEIKTMLAGNSIYLETTGESVTGKAGQGVIFYPSDGTSLYKTPAGVIWHGKWEIKDNTVCTNWNERPVTACSKYDKAGDAVLIIDVSTGKTRAKIVKTAPGNPENLAP